MPIALLWVMGFHSTFTNKAAAEIGMYVAINTGKVIRYKIFLNAEQCIFFHSVMRVKRPSPMNIRYPLNSVSSTDSAMPSMLFMSGRLTKKPAIFTTTAATVSMNAGDIDIIIS